MNKEEQAKTARIAAPEGKSIVVEGFKSAAAVRMLAASRVITTDSMVFVRDDDDYWRSSYFKVQEIRDASGASIASTEGVEDPAPFTFVVDFFGHSTEMPYKSFDLDTTVVAIPVSEKDPPVLVKNPTGPDVLIESPVGSQQPLISLSFRTKHTRSNEDTDGKIQSVVVETLHVIKLGLDVTQAAKPEYAHTIWEHPNILRVDMVHNTEFPHDALLHIPIPTKAVFLDSYERKIQVQEIESYHQSGATATEYQEIKQKHIPRADQSGQRLINEEVSYKRATKVMGTDKTIIEKAVSAVQKALNFVHDGLVQTAEGQDARFDAGIHARAADEPR